MWKKITSIKLIEKIKKLSKAKKILLILGVVVFAFLIIAFVYMAALKSSSEKEITGSFVQNQVIVKYKVDLSRDESFQQKLIKLGIISQEKVFKTSNNSTLSRYYLLKLKDGTDVRKLIGQLSKFNELEAAEPNYILSTQNVPNDPYYSELWGFQKIDMPNAWNLGTGTIETKVAVVDTGVDGSHPEFSDRIAAVADCTSGDCVNSSATDNQYHGTHLAGTIGAAGNDGFGIPGINWDIRFVVAKVLKGPDGKGDTTWINSGIVFAADNGARVINLSLGGYHSCTSLEQDAINYALNKGAVIIVAAGNGNPSGIAVDASTSSPANCNEVIVVGATGPNDERASYSNFGSTVSISAPGGNSNGATKTATNTIYSTAPGGSYQLLQGTSMATPHVAGVAALLLSINPGLAPSQVKSCLIDNADPISTDRPIGPRLNAFKTLNACSGLTPITPEPLPTGNSQASPTPATQSLFIDGTVYLDTNNNNQIDPDIDQKYTGAKVSITGVKALESTTNTAGYFKFENLIAGEYNLSWVVNGATVNYDKAIKIGPSPDPVGATINLLLSETGPIAQTPTLTLTPTPTGSAQPTNPPAQPKATNTPTPTPMVFYNCVFDPKCVSNQKSIQFCPLICNKK
jgi:subtilisin family serine protease